MIKVSNPYLDALPPGLTGPQRDAFLDRFNCNVGKDDRRLLRSTCVDDGVYTFVVGNLLMKLCNELRKYSITDITREADFRDAVANCTITLPESCRGSNRLPNSPIGGLVREAVASNVGDGTKTMGGEDTGRSHSPSDVSSKGGTKGKKGRGSVK